MIKPDRIPFNDIRKRADDFRKSQCDNLCPVPIEDIIEFNLGIEIRPVAEMLKLTDIDALLSNDLKVIFVDKSLVENHRYLFRYRFALAHEVGHIVLHSEKIKSLKFSSTEEWISLRKKFNKDDLMWFENQAMEFGGRLMVPHDQLLTNIMELKPLIQKFFDSYPEGARQH